MDRHKNDYIEVNFLNLTVNLINRFFRILLNFIKYFFKISLRYYYIIIFAIVITIFLYIKDRYTPPVYYSDLIIGSETIPANVLITDINKINKINFYSIFKISDSNDIKIKAYWLIDIDKDNIPDYIDLDNSFPLKHKKDTTIKRISNRIVIRISYTKNLSSKKLKDIQNGLLTYLNSITYNKKTNNILKENFSLKLQTTNKEYKIIDSATKLYYINFTKTFVPMYNSNQVVFLGEKYNTYLRLYHNQIISLYDTILKYRKIIEFTNQPVYIISPVLYREKVTFTNRYFNLKNIIIIILITFFLLFIIDKYKFYHKSYPKP